MWAAPIGAFGAIAFTVGKFGVGSLVSLGKLLGGFYVTCLIFIVVVLGPIARVRRLQPAEADPLHQGGAADLHRDHVVGNRAAAHDRASSKTLGCEESVVGLVIPTGYSFNLDGTCLYLATAAVFPGAGDEHAARHRPADRAACWSCC